MRKVSLQTWIVLFISLTQIFNLSPAESRWASYKDAPIEYVFFNRDVTVKANGHSEEIFEYQIKILNEKGRIYAVQTLAFNESISHIEILEAKTIVQGKEYKIPKEAIEIKPLASSIQGFDQLMQVMVSYPQAAVGSELYLKYKMVTSKQPLPDYFATNFWYGGQGYWRQSQVKIKSELPFHILINDPYKRLEVKEGKQGKFQTLHLHLKKPVYEELVNEPEDSRIEPACGTWVSISTCDDFNHLAKTLAKDYENVLKQPLPPQFKLIQQTALKGTSPTEQINTVTSMLSESINYMGDWKSIEGRFFPRSLEVISNSGIGDCKDFSAATAAILSSMGYKAQIALIMRGEIYLAPEKGLPSLNNQNHAIVKVTDKQGKVFWADPTNMTSFSEGIYPDIANRPVFVLDSQHPTQEKTPEVDFKNARILFESTMSLQNDRDLNVQGKYKLLGEEAIGMTAAALSNSTQSFEEGFIYGISGDREVLNKKVVMPDFASRIVKDIEITYSYEQENSLIPSTAGSAILIEANWPAPFLDTSEDHEGCMFVGNPRTLAKKIIIKSAGVKNLESLAYKIDLPWMKAKRECFVNGNDIEIVEQIEILKSFISSKELKSPQYKDFKKTLKQQCKKFAVIMAKAEKDG